MSSDDDDGAPPRPCSVCGNPMDDARPWLLLNRYGIGTGSGRSLHAPLNCDGDVVWEMGDDDAENEHASGPMTCWPVCTNLYIEGKMAETDVVLRDLWGDDQ